MGVISETYVFCKFYGITIGIRVSVLVLRYVETYKSLHFFDDICKLTIFR